jgi:fucose permease
MSSAVQLPSALQSNLQGSRAPGSFAAFACALFAVLGVVTTLLGPTLPLLSVRWSISTAQAGSLFFCQFLASTIGTVLSGAILSRRSFKLQVLLGVVFCLLGVAALIQADWVLGRYAVACYGFGLGITLPAVNLAVAEANPARRAASVSVLNFAWGIGAVSGPVLLRFTHSLDLFLTLLSALVAVGLIGSTVCPMPSRRTDGAVPLPAAGKQKQFGTIAAMLGFSMFLFCGIENAISGWASSLALPSFSNAYTATSANVAFWALFLAGRALAPAVLRIVSEARLLLVSILLTGAGVLALYFAGHAATILLACALAGLGVGPGFPLLISQVSELIGSGRPAATICFAFAGVGASTLPALVGIISARVGQPRAGLMLLLGGLLTLLAMTRGFGHHKISSAVVPS